MIVHPMMFLSARPKLANWIVWLYAHFIEILPLKLGPIVLRPLYP